MWRVFETREYITTMKKLIFFALVAILVACNNNNDPEILVPTDKEKNMVTEMMMWQLDSILDILYYQQPNEQRQMFYPSDGIDVVTYTLYPSTYQFPEDLYCVNVMTGETEYYSDLYAGARDFCKYTCSYEGKMVSAGYLMYYNDLFTFNGTKQNGMMEFRILETEGWKDNVWELAYNPEETEDGVVIERHIEYYSRVR